MLFEIEVLAGDNSPMDLNRVFDLLSEPRTVSRVFTVDPKEEDRWCAVTGWGDEGPCPARAVLAEDSGDGVILLLFGGEHGIRLKPAESQEEWDLDNPNQWGEPCLMLDKDSRIQEA